MRRVLAAALLVAAAVTAATATASRVVAQRFTFGGEAIGNTYVYGNDLVLFNQTRMYNWRAPRPVPHYPGGNADTRAMLRTSVWSPGNFTVLLRAKPGKYRVTLHFVETWATGPGQRLFDVAVSVFALELGSPTWTGLDLFAAAGGRAYVPVNRTVDVTVPPIYLYIGVRLIRAAANYPCISGMTVEAIDGGGSATLSPSSSPSRATTLSPLPSPAPTPTAMPTLNGTGAAAGGSPRRGALPRRGARL